MSNMGILDSTRPEYDKLLSEIADYTVNYKINSSLAIETARYCLMDTLGCGLLALKYSQCTKLLGPVVPEASLTGGARIPGTSYELDPVQAAFNIGTMIRWLDYNDTWLAAEWGHPSDNLGAILAIADYLSRKDMRNGKASWKLNTILEWMIKAHEIQGILALQNSFNKVGLDHVLLVRIASTAVSCAMLGGNADEVKCALSHAFIDGGALRTYRHAPNTGSRKSWAAGDATSRAVNLALKALTGEMGYPSALSADFWGFQDVLFKGQELTLERKLGTYVMENILFKISFPAEFHAQTAVECALELFPKVNNRLDDVLKIVIKTQESGHRIINKTGPLNNPADRDHCMQYMVATPLIFGELTADHYEDNIASDPRVDRLRDLMECSEEISFSEDYMDPEKRSIANSIQVFFTDGSSTKEVTVHYPVGHKTRRKEGMPLLIEKFAHNLRSRFDEETSRQVEDLFNTDNPDLEKLMKLMALTQ